MAATLSSNSFAALLTTFADAVQAFDRGVALAQVAFPAERIKRILEKAAASQNQLPEARRHLDRFSPG